MKSITLVFVITLYTVLLCHSQTKQPRIKFDKDSVYTIIERAGKAPYVYIGVSIYSGKKDLLSVRIKRSKDSLKFPNQRIFYLKLKSNCEIISLDEALKLYHLNRAILKLPIYVDDYPTSHILRIVRSNIKDVKIVTWKGNKYINIMTTNPPPPGNIL